MYMYNHRPDTFSVSLLFKKAPKFHSLFEVSKIVGILSHGNAAIESVFSINSETLVCMKS